MKTVKPQHLSRGALALAVLCLLQACAQSPHAIGLEQIRAGDVAQGLGNLRRASAENPGNSSYRADYLRERDKLSYQLLYEAAGQRARGDLEQAEKSYLSVLQHDNENAQARQGLTDLARVRRHAEWLVAARDAWARGERDAPVRMLQSILLENPNHAEATALLRQYNEERSGLVVQPAVVPTLGEAYRKPVSLQYRDANLKMIFESIARVSGVNIIVDREVKPDLKATLFVQKASVEDTLNLLLLQNQLEKRIINENTVYVYPATPAKLKEQQDLVVRVFQLVNADAKQMQNLLKTVLKVKEIFVNEKSNSLVIRDTPEVATLAARLLSSQDVTEPEIMLEVEVIEVARNALQDIGITYPDQLTLSAGDPSSSAAKGGMTLQQLRDLNSSGVSVYSGTGPINLALKLKQQSGDVDILASPKIRVRQKEKAKIHIGDRVPIITNTVTPQASGMSLYTGAVQYIEVGIKLEVEPDVHPDGEVGIKTSLEVSSISDKVVDTKSGTTAYQIGTRTANTVLRLRDGETQILAGLINNTELQGSVKVPGLGEIPLLGRLFSSNSRDRRKTEIVLAMTPRIIRNIRQPDADLSTYWSGTDSAVKIAPVMSGKTEGLRMDGQAIVTGGRTARTPVVPSLVAPETAEDTTAQGQSPAGSPPVVPGPAPAAAVPAPTPAPAPAPVAVPAPVSAAPTAPLPPGVSPWMTPAQITRQQLITDAFRVAPPKPRSAVEETPAPADAPAQ